MRELEDPNYPYREMAHTIKEQKKKYKIPELRHNTFWIKGTQTAVREADTMVEN